MISTYIFHDHIFEDNPVPKGVPLSDGDKPVPGEKNLHLIGLNLTMTEHSLYLMVLSLYLMVLNLYMTEHSLYLMVLSPVPAGAEPVYLMVLSLCLMVLSPVPAGAEPVYLMLLSLYLLVLSLCT